MVKRLCEVVEKFRQKGATSPDKAMTPQELGLPPRFEEAMHSRLGRIRIFVEVHSKYYLSEERLKELEERRNRGRYRGGGGGGWWSSMLILKIARMALAVSLVVLVLVNLFVYSWELRLIVIGEAVTCIALMIAQIVYLSRTWKRPCRIKTNER
jgi:hypothetical protein